MSPSTWSNTHATVPNIPVPTLPRRLAREDAEIGRVGEPFVAPPLTITDFVRYQGAAGDLNPIHHDAAFAQSAGYPGPFAVGMLQAGILGTYVTEWFGARSIRRFGVRFRELAWPGDILTYQGSIVSVRDEDGDRIVDLTLSVLRQTGGTHLTGWATVSL